MWPHHYTLEKATFGLIIGLEPKILFYWCNGTCTVVCVGGFFFCWFPPPTFYPLSVHGYLLATRKRISGCSVGCCRNKTALFHKLFLNGSNLNPTGWLILNTVSSYIYLESCSKWDFLDQLPYHPTTLTELSLLYYLPLSLEPIAYYVVLWQYNDFYYL